MQCCKLRIPAWSLLLHDVHMLLAIVFGAELSQCFDHRIVGFLAGKPFHTLTTRDVHVAVATELPAEEIDQRGFAHTGLPGNESDLAIALCGLLQQAAQPLELLLPPDDAPRLRPTSVNRVAGGLFYLRQEPVATPRNSANESRAFHTVAQQFAQLQYVGAQHLRLDVGLGPQLVEQLIVRHQPLRVFHQVAQHGKRLWRQAYLDPVLPQTFIPGIELKTAKLFHCVSAWIGMLVLPLQSLNRATSRPIARRSYLLFSFQRCVALNQRQAHVVAHRVPIGKLLHDSEEHHEGALSGLLFGPW